MLVKTLININFRNTAPNICTYLFQNIGVSLCHTSDICSLDGSGRIHNNFTLPYSHSPFNFPIITQLYSYPSMELLSQGLSPLNHHCEKNNARSPEYWDVRAYSWIEECMDKKEKAYRWQCAFKGMYRDGSEAPMPHPAFVHQSNM